METQAHSTLPPLRLEDRLRRLAGLTTRGISIYSEQTSDFQFLSYSSLLALGVAAAARLEQAGLRRQERVLLTAHSTADFIITWMGLMLLGATPVPLPPRKTLAGEGAFKHRLQPLLPYHRVFLCEAEEREEILGTPGSERLELLLMEELAAGLSLEQDCVTRGRLPGEDEDALVQYTSGSTGRPKGTVLTARNLVANVQAIAEVLCLDPERHTFASWLPLYHDMGLVGMLLNCMLNATSLVVVPPPLFARRPLRFLRLVEEFRATHCAMPNFALEWILRTLASGSKEAFRLESLEWVGVGSEPINPETLRRFQRELGRHGLRPTALSPCYGMAEATLAVSASSPFAPFKLTRYRGQEVPCVGPLMQGFEVKLEPVEGYEGAGLIKLRGESVSRYSYVGAEKVARLDAEGFHSTGDIGLLHEGELVILGRTDEMFIVNGANCFPYDMEGVVRALPLAGLRRVACFGAPESEAPSARHRLVVLYEAADLTEEARQRNEELIRQQVLGRTGLRVDEVVALPPRSIPVTTSGKIQRRRALALYQAGHYRAAESSTPLPLAAGETR